MTRSITGRCPAAGRSPSGPPPPRRGGRSRRGAGAPARREASPAAPATSAPFRTRPAWPARASAVPWKRSRNRSGVSWTSSREVERRVAHRAELRVALVAHPAVPGAGGLAVVAAEAPPPQPASPRARARRRAARWSGRRCRRARRRGPAPGWRRWGRPARRRRSRRTAPGAGASGSRSRSRRTTASSTQLPERGGDEAAVLPHPADARPLRPLLLHHRADVDRGQRARLRVARPERGDEHLELLLHAPCGSRAPGRSGPRRRGPGRSRAVAAVVRHRQRDHAAAARQEQARVEPHVPLRAQPGHVGLGAAGQHAVERAGIERAGPGDAHLVEAGGAGRLLHERAVEGAGRGRLPYPREAADGRIRRSAMRRSTAAGAPITPPRTMAQSAGTTARPGVTL